MREHLGDRHVVQFADEGAIPVSRVFDVVEEDAVGVYLVDPYIGFVVPFPVPYFMEAASRDEELFERASVDFPQVIVLVHILQGRAQDLAQRLVFPVAGDAYGLSLYRTELAHDIFHQFAYQVVFQRDFSLFFQVLLFAQGASVGQVDVVAPLVAEGVIAAAGAGMAVTVEVVPCAFGLPQDFEIGLVGLSFPLCLDRGDALPGLLLRHQVPVVENAIIGFFHKNIKLV